MKNGQQPTSISNFIPLNGQIKSQDLNSNVKHLNDTIYSYFTEYFGKADMTTDKNFVIKYKDRTLKDLKSALNLKSDVTERRYVSRILCSKLSVHNNIQTKSNHDPSINHDKYIQRNFWGYVKKVLTKKDVSIPSFGIAECVDYFSKTLAAIDRNKMFHIPNWIPKLSDPQTLFDLDPPTYQKVTAVIRKIKHLALPTLSIKFQLYDSNDVLI